ncbi:MAG: DUF3108 domain-containing protein [Agitococcus sp.]
MRFLLLITSLSFGVKTFAFDLQPYTATYQFNLNQQITGTATRTLSKQENNHYRYQFNATAAIANANEVSEFIFDKQQVQSLSYQNSKQVLFKNRVDQATFDWDKQQLTTLRKGQNETFPLTNKTILDPLNLEIQIRQDLSLQTKPQLKEQYVLGDAKGVHPLKFSIDGTEKIKTPYAELETLKVSRVHTDKERTTQFWLAKSLDYLPVKVVQVDDGAVYTIELQSLQK